MYEIYDEKYDEKYDDCENYQRYQSYRNRECGQLRAHVMLLEQLTTDGAAALAQLSQSHAQTINNQTVSSEATRRVEQSLTISGCERCPSQSWAIARVLGAKCVTIV